MGSGSRPRALRWGILGCGGIAKTWAQDLLIDPATRGAKDVAHVIVAAGSSTSREKAQIFIDGTITKLVKAGKDDAGRPISEAQRSLGGRVKAYGTYESLVKDSDIDVIYVATPHSHHYDNTRLALEHGKHVLCEKSFTVNAAQTKALAELARSKKLFLLEALWTRHFPITKEIQDVVQGGKIGRVVRTFSDLSMPFDPDNLPNNSRMIDPNLAGGALLDLGIYPLTWAWLMGYNANDREKPQVTGSVLKSRRTGVDESTVIVLNWLKAHQQSIVTCNMVVHTPKDNSIRVEGDQGTLIVEWGPFRPTSYVIKIRDQPDSRTEIDIPGHGMFWQCDEVYRCLKKGKLESEILPLDESVDIMEVMDEVRRQGGLKYPAAIERL